MQPPGQPSLKRTILAEQAVDFAGLFNRYFAAGLRGPVDYKIDLTTPQGLSTEKGKLALQHLRLLPVKGGPAIVIGSVHRQEHMAEIRTLSALAEVHAQRFKGARLPIDAAAYDQLVKGLTRFFELEQLRVNISAVAPSMAPPPLDESTSAPRSGARTALLVVALFVVFALAGAIVAWLLHPH